MVKVGDFWVDRYEMSIVDATTYAGGKCNGSGTQYGASSDNYDAAGFPDWGKATTKLYACSRSGNKPSASMTWFQAAAACAFAGKHLCTNGEWQTAALGTPDDSSSCNVSTSGPENAGNRAACISQSGAFDMVGNLREWVDLWGQAGKVNASYSSGALACSVWPSGYEDGKDCTWNVNGEAHNGSAWTTGMPAAALRGGHWYNGPDAGVFAMALNNGPSSWDTYNGARCCRQ
jgi:formylglycine-generating enzyme required for sulfatase activity